MSLLLSLLYLFSPSTVSASTKQAFKGKNHLTVKPGFPPNTLEEEGEEVKEEEKRKKERKEERKEEGGEHV